ALDAIVRVIYRRITSHRLLLEWETAADAHRRARSRELQFILSRLWIPATCVLLFVGAESRGTAAMVAAAPFLLLGALFPVTVAANDFGYMTIDDLVDRNLRTLETLGRLERFEGHLFNWYDLSTLEPLRPRYVSAVDSGNLLASLWTFQTSCDELAARPLLD